MSYFLTQLAVKGNSWYKKSALAGSSSGTWRP